MASTAESIRIVLPVRRWETTTLINRLDAGLTYTDEIPPANARKNHKLPINPWQSHSTPRSNQSQPADEPVCESRPIVKTRAPLAVPTEAP